VKFAPRGEFGPHGWTLTPRVNVHPFGHSQGSTLFRRIEGRPESFHTYGTKTTPGGLVKNWPQYLGQLHVST
jgi:hypothetical protein